MLRFVACALLLSACGPSQRDGGDDDPNAPCNPGTVEDCYNGQPGTENVGPCRIGSRTCTDQGLWTQCEGEIVPAAEQCTDSVDNNCNGAVDEDVDEDGDGVTTCGGDCCDSTECSDPGLVNPGAFDAPGNSLDDNCDGVVDNTQLVCDTGLSSGTNDAMDFARAIELCETATMADSKWGVISAKLSLADGNGTPHQRSHAIRGKFGNAVLAKGGVSLALLSTGAAAGKGDTNPAWHDFQESPLGGNGTSSGFPADFLQANGGNLPNAPNCPAADGNTANDPVMLTLQVRVPTNAKSFKLDTNFFSSEFPEYTCSPFNDFFVVLLDSTYAGSPANPADKNLAFYAPPGSTMKYPVGVNLASGDTGLFTQCINGRTGCALGARAGTITTCTGVEELAGTGLDSADGGTCDSNARQGGGTGWLQTSGNVVGGEIITLRIAIWDTSDEVLDSIAAIDNFTWSVDAAEPGTVIFASP
jgi:hypothetical protein